MPVISRIISLGKTGPLGLSSPTAACLTYARLLSLLLSVLPGQSDFMIHQGPHKGKAGERAALGKEVGSWGVQKWGEPGQAPADLFLFLQAGP